jgi:hypothetical protein
MKRPFIGALVALAATPALAQAETHHEQYYVVRDPETKKCAVVVHRPTDSAALVGVGVYKTQAEAEAEVKVLDVCHDDEDEDTHGN